MVHSLNSFALSWTLMSLLLSSGVHPLRMEFPFIRSGGNHVLMKLKVRRGAHSIAHYLVLPLINPMAQKSFRRVAQWMGAASCRENQDCREPSARRNNAGFICRGSILPCGSAGGRIEFDIKAPFVAPLLSSLRGDLLVFSTSGYIRKTALGWHRNFPSHRWAANGYRASTARLPITLLATRCKQAVFVCNQVIGPPS